MKNSFYLALGLVLISFLALTACGGGGATKLPAENKQEVAQKPPATPTPASKGDAAVGEKAFVATCSACHGPKGEGIQNLGKDMTTSQFIAGKTDDELVAFVKVGRDPSDPLNTTGVAMPPKGGNPALQDQDLYNIVAYIRSLQK
jgi:disulfide bond formation protein DsbB